LSVELLKNLTVKVDKLRALFALSTYSILGRKKLASVLGVGEGYARNIISGLKKDGLVKEDRHGIALTEEGKRFLAKIFERVIPYFNIGVLEFPNSKAVLVKNAGEYVKIGLEERDWAIKMGSAGALIITHSKGNFWFPGLSNLSDEYPQLVMSVKHLNPEENDVIIITWGSTQKDTERGALGAALELIKKAGNPISV